MSVCGWENTVKKDTLKHVQIVWSLPEHHLPAGWYNQNGQGYLNSLNNFHNSLNMNKIIRVLAVVTFMGNDFISCRGCDEIQIWTFPLKLCSVLWMPTDNLNYQEGQPTNPVESFRKLSEKSCCLLKFLWFIYFTKCDTA